MMRKVIITIVSIAISLAIMTWDDLFFNTLTHGLLAMILSGSLTFTLLNIFDKKIDKNKWE